MGEEQQGKPWGLISLFLLVGVLVGAGGGYYFGLLQGRIQGMDEASAMFEMQQTQQHQQAQAVVETNPLDEATTNPLEDVQTNPFDY